MRYFFLSFMLIVLFSQVLFAGNRNVIAPSGTQYMRRNIHGGYDFYNRNGKLGWSRQYNYYDRRGLYMRNYNNRIYNTRRR